MSKARNDESPKQRRTQKERADAMRQRILDATLYCLAHDGYAGTTISRVIEVAEVSRGAPVHHFPNKNAMIAAAAEQLARQLYIQLGKAISKLEASDDRLHELIYVCWKDIFKQPEYVAMNELLQASRRDPELAKIMRQLWIIGVKVVFDGADHYLEPIDDKFEISDLMILTQWVIRGMAEDLHLMFNEKIFDRYLKLWSQILAQHIKAREGINTPPPRPDKWDHSLLADE
ncbi:MAG: TetR/AcrR family transcriptional regulator [Pseudomonadales bacterium]|nr:TetR/AcrR family transcriptional regulator [Pseudomonadales bacterium]